MSTENTLDTTSTGGTSAASTSSSVDTPAAQTSTPATSTEGISAATGAANAPATGAPAVKDIAAAAMAAVKEGVIPAAPTAPAYTPNFKYKAAQQEKEIDPFFQALIKDADSEKKVKDLLTRADGLDYMKNRYEARDKEYQSLNNDYASQTQLVNSVNEAKAKGDLDSVFRKVGLNDHQVIQWAAKRVDYLQMMQQLPPEQRQALQQQEQAVIQNQEYQTQMQQLQTEVQQQKVQARTIMLDQQLSRPEVVQAATFWDQKMGQDGAFKDLVIEEAQREWYMKQVDLPVDQAVQRVLQRFGKFIDVQNAGQQNQSAQGNAPYAPQMPQAKPIIPAVPGSSKTPIKRQYRSLDDIKARAKELEATP